MAVLEVTNCKIADVLREAKTGQIKIPQFQRRYVWSVSDCAKLMDSIMKDYPVGALIYWKTKEHLRSVRNVGNFSFKDMPNDDFVYYILDGQQRITSIIASINGEKIGDDNYSEIYVDLTASADDQIVTTNVEGLTETQYISLCELYSATISDIVDKYPRKVIDKISDYQGRINNYMFSKVQLSEASLDIATEVFTRINTSGKSLSIFEIMCAKMYSETPLFDLYEKREDQKQRWALASYESVPDATVLQAISACLCKDCKGKAILRLDKSTFMKEWDAVDKAFNMTIDYFKNTYNIPVSKLVPYDALFVPFVYYFYKKKARPSGNRKKWLKDYFWRSTFSMRFTEGAVSKINQDLTNVMDKIIKGIQPTYDQGLVISGDSIKRNGEFTVGSAYIKGMLGILCSKRPVSFLDGHAVTIDNSWLSQGNSKNYHHFFPKEYMRKHKPSVDYSLVNHIVNITIVDDWLNKGKIKAKAPSKYMKEFADVNVNIKKDMKTHLIDDLKDFGVLSDNYDKFFKKRLKAFHAEMVSLIEPQKDDDLSF